MPTDRGYHPMDDPFIAELFHREYTGLVRYAEIMYRKCGGYVDPGAVQRRSCRRHFPGCGKAGRTAGA